jgi:DNA-binding response OmpR family regulator
MTTRIVLIEDDPEIATVVEELLVDVGHEVDVRPRLEDGPIDGDARLVISDLVVDGGYDLATARAWIARVRAAFPHAAIVVLTGHERAARSGAPAIGADAVLTKPFDFSALTEIVESLLGR